MEGELSGRENVRGIYPEVNKVVQMSWLLIPATHLIRAVEVSFKIPRVFGFLKT